MTVSGLRRAGRRSALLSGDPGIGKTRLASELRADAERAGFLALEGRGDHGVDLPYMTFRESIFPALAATAGVGLVVSTIVRWRSPTVTRLTSGRPTTWPRRPGLLLELSELVYEGAAQRPILLLLDDLQWADHSSLALVRHLAFRLSGGLKATGLYVLARHVPPAVAPLRLEQRCAVLELAGLDPFESADLARRLGATRVAPAELWERTEGNPLLIECSARGGGVTPFETDWHVLFEERLRSLSATALAVLERAALLVPDLAIDAICRLGLWEPAAVFVGVDEAIAAGVLTSDDGELRFAHPVLRDACVRAMGPIATARAHAEIADALGPPEGPALITVARHLVLAGRQADADVVARTAASAGHRAWGMGAWEDAAAFFEAALDAQERCAHPASAD